jgi:hypothetical protein
MRSTKTNSANGRPSPGTAWRPRTSQAWKSVHGCARVTSPLPSAWRRSVPHEQPTQSQSQRPYSRAVDWSSVGSIGFAGLEGHESRCQMALRLPATASELQCLQQRQNLPVNARSRQRNRRHTTLCMDMVQGAIEHYGFIAMTEPGSMGPKGRAARWRITDMAWGELDGRPVEATKDYLRWNGVRFEQPSQKQKNGELNSSGRRGKYVTSDELNTSDPLPPDDVNTSEGRQSIYESNSSNLGKPSPPAKRGRAEATCRYCGEVTDEAALTELHQGFFIHEACQKEWSSNGRGN